MTTTPAYSTPGTPTPAASTPATTTPAASTPGNSNTGFANSGDVNTGAFNSGNYSNGFFWRGDYQGLGGFAYQSAVSEIPWSYDIGSNIEIPIEGDINAITQDAFTIDEFEIPIKLRVSVCVIYIPFKGCVKHVSVTIPITTEHLGPYEIDASTINPDQPIDTAFTQTLDFAGSGTVGAFPFGFGWQQSPGFFNSTTTPSSGFFNSGAGGASGFLNDAAAAVSGLGNVFTETSGFFNAGGVGNSGFQNFGNLLSGWANLGNTVSGSYNTSMLDLATQALISGFGNHGARLSGILNNGSGP